MPRPSPETVERLAAIIHGPEFAAQPAGLAYISQVNETAADPTEARAMLTAVKPGSINLTRERALLLAEERTADVFLLCFTQILAGSKANDPKAYTGAVTAGAEVAGLTGLRAETVLRLALTGLLWGPDLRALWRLTGSQEFVERATAAIRTVEAVREARHNAPFVPSPAGADQIRQFAAALLGSTQLERPEFRQLTSDMARRGVSVFDAVEWLRVFRPGGMDEPGPHLRSILAVGTVDVALLCFAQIYGKAQGHEKSPYQRAVVAASEVSGISVEVLKAPLAASITGLADWPFELERTFDMISASEVTARIKTALAVIARWRG